MLLKITWSTHLVRRLASFVFSRAQVFSTEAMGVDQTVKRFACTILAGLAVTSTPTITSADLFRNGGFEETPSSGTGQGLLPSHWIAISQSADTYSNDGSYGLFPYEFGNFPGVLAYSGLRWVAGANTNMPAGGESFGQVLSVPLQAGVTYRVDGWLHQALRSDLNSPGGYDLWLDKGDFGQRLLVGHLGDTTSPAAGWNPFSNEFIAPSNVAEYTRFVFAPIASGNWGTYPGLDEVSLIVVPEPSSLLLLLLATTSAVVCRRKIAGEG